MNLKKFIDNSINIKLEVGRNNPTNNQIQYDILVK